MASDTRNRILSVAARLFEALGFEGTAVAAILREADVNSGSLYHFFPSKEALLVAVLEKYLSMLEPSLLGAANRAADDPIAKVFALLELYRGRLLVSEFARGCPVGDLSLEIGGRLPEARRLADAYFVAWTERVEGWFDDAGDRLSAGADRHALSVHVLSVLQGGIMQARAAASIEPFDHSVTQLRLLIDFLGSDAEATTSWPVRGRLPAAAAAERERAMPIGGEDDAWWRAW